MPEHTIDPASITGDHNAPYPRPQPSQARAKEAPTALLAELEVQVERLRGLVEDHNELMNRLTRRITALESKVARLEATMNAPVIERDDGK